MITILHEDAAVIAVAKPQGISAIPERDLSIPSIRTIMEQHLGKRLFVVHRLDKEVSGVMLFAKTAEAHRYLNGEFSGRRIRKTYLALVHGLITADQGIIDAPIRQFGSGRMGVDFQNGKPSVTRFKVLERRDPHTLIEAYPETGRRHQIRVHLYHIGHPIVGDRRYGDKNLRDPASRLMLHAARVEWKNPDGSQVAVECQAPEEFHL